MRSIPIAEFKGIIDAIAQQYPDACVDFVYPKSRGGKRQSALGRMTQYSFLMTSSSDQGGTVRIYIDWARDDPTTGEVAA